MTSFQFTDIFFILLRLRKIIFGSDVLSIPINKYELKKYGNEGAHWVIQPIITNESIVYSFGVGNDISFDLEIINEFGVTVHAFDPTPKTQQWLLNQELPKQFVFNPIGLAAFDGTVKFFLPENPNHVSASIVSAADSSNFFDAPVNRLATIANTLNHNKIDILKMDIEGAEYDVIDDILASGIEIKQILIEFHHRFKEVASGKTRTAISKLKKHGYKVVHVSQKTGEEYTFIKR